MPDKLRFPSKTELLANLKALAAKEDAIRRSLSALQTGKFQHPDGRVDPLGRVRVAFEQAGLLAYLAAQCPTPLSIEVGFGMGSTAAVILGTRRLQRKPFVHVIYDPYGLPENAGEIVQSYLESRFPKAFRRLRTPSEIGLGRMIEQRGRGIAGLIFIDGGHLFENVMADFILADQLVCLHGHIVLDDAASPAIECVVNYVKANRPDYLVAHLAVPNCTVLQKIAQDSRPWYSFKPFEVPQREDWTRVEA